MFHPWLSPKESHHRIAKSSHGILFGRYEARLEKPPGYKPGFWQKILASDLDEVNKCGGRSRLLRISIRVYSEVPFVHDHWEEVFPVPGRSDRRQ